ncbi:hypothetical protein BT67DRAFT_444703 [Trichocladium antarcticum]|uniref:Uncharacterized protein n=1 Tax=Trichocladium antarcticum TaxID=1450529 RepID=A0AAN6UEB7_9PEZI|nr:hypothetical protein BT67DRAFT_444703 [Trichocladium antarcticum]
MRWARAAAGARIPAAAPRMQLSARPIAAPQRRRSALPVLYVRIVAASKLRGTRRTTVVGSAWERGPSLACFPWNGAVRGAASPRWAPRFEGAWRAENRRVAVWKSSSTPGYAAWCGQVQTAGELGQGDVARAPEGGAAPGSTTWTAHIAAAALIHARQ